MEIVLSLKDRNVVETIRWVWVRFISFCIYCLGSGTIFWSFISGCNVSPTDTRIVFIAVSLRSLSFVQKRVAIVQKCYRYLEPCPYIYGTFVRFRWLLEVTRVVPPHTQPPQVCCLPSSPQVRSSARHVEHESHNATDLCLLYSSLTLHVFVTDPSGLSRKGVLVEELSL